MLLRPPGQTTRLRQGDVANVAMMAPDAHRAKEFYQAVLQVPFPPAHPGTWRTDQTSPPLSILPGPGAELEVQLSYRVDDIAAAVERVRAAGGRGSGRFRGATAAVGAAALPQHRDPRDVLGRQASRGARRDNGGRGGRRGAARGDRLGRGGRAVRLP